jgi:membrane-associated protease RseP (regulator of RpoE activity)
MTLRSISLHVSLFILTFITTTFAGVAWSNLDPLELNNFPAGLLYGTLIVTMLLTHEMGHYLAARHHRMNATLPYFLPFPTHLVGLFPFGTLGAVIRLRSSLKNRRALLDIGAAGPIAGFVVSVAYLVIGFATLPSIEFLYNVHPLYRGMAQIPTDGLAFGTNMLYGILQEVVPAKGAFIPPMNEIYHYPFLCVGWFGLFMTAMNLLPVGQLDGGHIMRAMFGETARGIGRIVMILMAVVGVLGFLPLLGMSDKWGWSGWLFWAVMLYFIFERKKRRFSSPLLDDTPLGNGRLAIGWLCICILVLGFSLAPFTIGMG